VDKKLFKKNFSKAIIYFLFLYFGLYITFTAFGQYDDSASLAQESIYPISRRNIWAIWQPEYLVWDSKSWNFGGLFFSPLIKLDRLFWHKTRPSTNVYKYLNR
jgi:hypothetical protein